MLAYKNLFAFSNISAYVRIRLCFIIYIYVIFFLLNVIVEIRCNEGCANNWNRCVMCHIVLHTSSHTNTLSCFINMLGGCLDKFFQNSKLH